MYHLLFYDLLVTGLESAMAKKEVHESLIRHFLLHDSTWIFLETGPESKIAVKVAHHLIIIPSAKRVE